MTQIRAFTDLEAQNEVERTRRPGEALALFRTMQAPESDRTIYRIVPLDAARVAAMTADASPSDAKVYVEALAQHASQQCDILVSVHRPGG